MSLLISEHTLYTQMLSLKLSKKTLHVQNSLAPSIPTIQLLIAYSMKTNEQEVYIAKPQNEARSDTQLPEEGRSAVIYRYAS